jgi:hypothetical protein
MIYSFASFMVKQGRRQAELYAIFVFGYSNDIPLWIWLIVVYFVLIFSSGAADSGTKNSMARLEDDNLEEAIQLRCSHFIALFFHHSIVPSFYSSVNPSLYSSIFNGFIDSSIHRSILSIDSSTHRSTDTICTRSSHLINPVHPTQIHRP